MFFINFRPPISKTSTTIESKHLHQPESHQVFDWQGLIKINDINIIFIRGQALTGSGHGVRRSWQGALIMPPASRPTEPLTRNSFNSSRQKFFFPSSWVTRNTFPLGRTYLVAFHRVGAKTLLFYPCGSSLLGGWVALPEWLLVMAPHLVLKQGTPLNFGPTGRMGVPHLVHEQIFRNGFCETRRRARGWRAP